MLKQKIPLLAPLCLTLTSAAACGPSPESVAEDLCMKFVECYPGENPEIEGQSYVEYCTDYYTEYFKEVEELYSGSCADALVDYFACISSSVTCGVEPENICETEEKLLNDSCEFDEESEPEPL